MAWKHDTPEKMREAGYGFVEWGYCRFCGALIQWWHTKKAKLMPIDASSINENCEPRIMPHFATCPIVAAARRRGGSPRRQGIPAIARRERGRAEKGGPAIAAPMSDKAYLGDGLYANWDGERIILTAEDGIRATNTVYLEADTWAALVDYIERLKKKALL